MTNSSLENLIYQATYKGFIMSVIKTVEVLHLPNKTVLQITPHRSYAESIPIDGKTDEQITQIIRNEARMAWLTDFDVNFEKTITEGWALLNLLESLVNDIFAQYGILVYPTNINGETFVTLHDFFRPDEDNGHYPQLGNPVQISDLIQFPDDVLRENRYAN